MKSVRCAIYTRKSTEDGLEQEFNSLDAQREACAAFIRSQLHEGWELVPDAFDDGGFSGGTMNRPGLQALLTAIEEGRVDVIVVYKVDRLTRSLADFAKIVERLDAKQASFVSVTQAFNTTTSMGRLTLNVLLSFAQFEREVTGERIRDKIAASKKKGLWMGGPVPLGYQVIDRKLIPVPEEAERVRTIMRRYVASETTDELLAQLEADGVRTKLSKFGDGYRGGIPFRRGSLFHLLGNAIYRGMMVHNGTLYPGEHEAIVDEDLWDAVQSKLHAKAPPRRRSINAQQDALFKGLITDPHKRPMVPTFTCKGPRRYRYYETRRDLARKGDPKATRFAMGQLDRHITDALQSLLADQHRLRRLTGAEDAKALDTIYRHARAAIEQLEGAPFLTIDELVSRIEVTDDQLLIALKPSGFGIDSDTDPLLHAIALPSKKPFREHKLRLDPENANQAEPDPKLVALLREARHAQELILADPTTSLNHLARREGGCRKHMARLLQVSWLSPGIVAAILDGKQPTSLTRAKLVATDLPMSWPEQERLLGFV